MYIPLRLAETRRSVCQNPGLLFTQRRFTTVFQLAHAFRHLDVKASDEIWRPVAGVSPLPADLTTGRDPPIGTLRPHFWPVISAGAAHLHPASSSKYSRRQRRDGVPRSAKNDPPDADVALWSSEDSGGF